jgi:hypothetical protein
MDWAIGGQVLAGAYSPVAQRKTACLYNERLALSLIRRHGSLPKAEIARLTGLSAQTVSVIVRQLENDNLLVKETPQRGKVGQPLVPFSLNPDGAFSIGLKIGRRSGDLILLDLTGKVRRKVHQPYVFPTPQKIMDFVAVELEGLLSGLSPVEEAGTGRLVAALPTLELGRRGWRLARVLEAWRDFGIARDRQAGRLAGAFERDRGGLRARNCSAPAAASRLMPISLWAILSAAALSSTTIFSVKAGYAGPSVRFRFDARWQPQQLTHNASLYVPENNCRGASPAPCTSPED